MNIENIDKCIAVMRRANDPQFDMSIYQASKHDTSFAYTEAEFHKCGNTACFAGHIAISPEWKADGGMIRYSSAAPEFPGCPAPDYGIACWLDLPRSLVAAIVYPPYSVVRLESVHDELQVQRELEHLVGSRWANWKPVHLIQILEAIKEKRVCAHLSYSYFYF